MELDNISSDISALRDDAMVLLMDYVPKLALALITLFVGLKLTKKATQLFKKVLEKRDADPTLIPFLSSVVNMGLKVLLIISVASMVGIATTSFVAVLGAAGLAVGLALQGSLSNFAGGVLILLFKPFKVGDYVEIDGSAGTVEGITILNTILATPQNNTLIIPNGTAANSKVLNYSQKDIRRVDLAIGIAYGEDVDKAKEVLLQAVKSDERVLDMPEPVIGIKGFGDSSVDFVVMSFCKSPDYWDTYFGVNRKMKQALDTAGIEIPFPQRELIIKSGSLS